VWNGKTEVRGVKTGNLNLAELFRNLSNIPGKHDIKELQKTAILDTAHILRKGLLSKDRTFIMGNNLTCTIHCNHSIAATYILETWFVSGISLSIPCRKVINNNNNLQG
jgi:hypothetical protein